MVAKRPRRRPTGDAPSYRTTYDGGEVAHLALEDRFRPTGSRFARPARLPGTWVARAFEEVAGEVFARLK
ncbi:MAG: hypothetical protein HPM95_10050 [Alphaproteobacteria bacterium]|nr:hypothetical protein [Alphaproteobacteria bacterium]